MGAKKKKALLTTTGAVVAQTISRCRIGCGSSMEPSCFSRYARKAFCEASISCGDNVPSNSSFPNCPTYMKIAHTCLLLFMETVRFT